ncbi:hypothetical protein [Streptomyces sp. MP131-18]|uniref:hypothetical protein n=1 Tax=Streptomyces sp. MP131-18 TaxID=1857892 RepID=UPI00097BBF2E|nr:hypothetical protein [Streptomyces sp. MP131-18]ONK13315.1 hypothetical protein STBA_40790 [Streptomyces sp. MP131-18]
MDRADGTEPAEASGLAERGLGVPNRMETRFALAGATRSSRGLDAGVSFRSAHGRDSGTTFTVVPNTTYGAWPPARSLAATLPG